VPITVYALYNGHGNGKSDMSVVCLCVILSVCPFIVTWCQSQTHLTF